MNKPCLSLVFVAYLLSHGCSLQESVDGSKGQQQDYSLELMAASIRQLTELSEKLEKRLQSMEKRLELMQSMEKRLELVQSMERRLELVEKEQKRLSEQDKIIHEKPQVDLAVDRALAGQQESHLDKRSDDTASWEPVVAQVTQRLNLAEANIQALKNSVVADQQGRGLVGGSWYADTGAASNYLCLPHDPNFDSHTIPRYGNAKLFGAEYQTCDEPECDLTPSCAVCRISRESYVMLPARNTCYPGWTFEYSGYIMTNSPTQLGGTEYICVDSSHKYTEGSGGDQNGALLHYTAYV